MSPSNSEAFVRVHDDCKALEHWVIFAKKLIVVTHVGFFSRSARTLVALRLKSWGTCSGVRLVLIISIGIFQLQYYWVSACTDKKGENNGQVYRAAASFARFNTPPVHHSLRTSWSLGVH